jgi:uncharacterized protein YkwD
MGDTRAGRRLVLGTVLLFALGGTTSPVTQVLAPHAAPAAAARAAKAAKPAATKTSAKWSGSVNANDRAAVNAAYLRDYQPGLRLPTGWNGNDSTCAAGTQSAASRAATLRGINFARSLAGLAPVAFAASLNSSSQLSALLMSANRSLSHTPPKTWKCYTDAGGANAGKSNLALSYPSITSSGVVGLYLEDAGSTNAAAGHRRWLLNPSSTTMGSGATNTAHAMTVVGPTSASRPNPSYVPWPTSGWFPNTLEPSGRWSLSVGNRALSFAWATVHVWRDGKPISVKKNAVVDGYGQPTLVWQLPANLTRSGTFKVQVTGIRATAKSTAYTSTYTVRMFTPGS